MLYDAMAMSDGDGVATWLADQATARLEADAAVARHGKGADTDIKLDFNQKYYVDRKDEDDPTRYLTAVPLNHNRTLTMQNWFDSVLQPDTSHLQTAIERLPCPAWALCLPIRLDRPLLSSGRSEQSVMDSVLPRDPVFRMPFLPETSLKGALAAAVDELDSAPVEDTAATSTRLFGSVLTPTQGQAGRLHPYPLFFPAGSESREILNPQSRATSSSSTLIWLESVPTGTLSTLAMTYAGARGGPGAGDEAEALEDLWMTACALRVLARSLGLGAKTSAGFGTFGLDCDSRGTLWVKQRVAMTSHPFGTFDELRTLTDEIRMKAPRQDQPHG